MFHARHPLIVIDVAGGRIQRQEGDAALRSRIGCRIEPDQVTDVHPMKARSMLRTPDIRTAVGEDLENDRRSSLDRAEPTSQPVGGELRPRVRMCSR